MLEAKYTGVLSDPMHPAWRKSNPSSAPPVVSEYHLKFIEVFVLQHVWPGLHALPCIYIRRSNVGSAELAAL